MSENSPEKPEGKTETMPTGDEVHEADDCRFVSSPSGTVHERDEWPGDGHDYMYHPRCGQRLPPESMWSRVEADSPEEAVVKYDLKPCTKCFSNSYKLRQKRREEHSNIVTDGGTVNCDICGGTTLEEESRVPLPARSTDIGSNVDAFLCETCKLALNSVDLLSDTDREEWRFEVGDVLVERDEMSPSFEGVGKVTGGTEYEVKYRFVDENGERFYHTEYDRGEKTDTQLKSATMVHNLYEKAGESA